MTIVSFYLKMFPNTLNTLTLEKTEASIKNGQSRDIGNIGNSCKTQDEEKQNKNHNTEH